MFVIAVLKQNIKSTRVKLKFFLQLNRLNLKSFLFAQDGENKDPS